MRRLAIGVYLDEPTGALHLCVPEILADQGLPDTPEGRDLAAENLAAVCRRLGIPVEVAD